MDMSASKNGLFEGEFGKTEFKKLRVARRFHAFGQSRGINLEFAIRESAHAEGLKINGEQATTVEGVHLQMQKAGKEIGRGFVSAAWRGRIEMQFFRRGLFHNR